MIMLLLICLLVGAVLGQRFKVLVLIPAIALAIAATVGFAHTGTFPQFVGAALVAMTCLQIGYAAGVGIHFFMAADRTSRKHAIAGPTSPRRVTN